MKMKMKMKMPIIMLKLAGAASSSFGSIAPMSLKPFAVSLFGNLLIILSAFSPGGPVSNLIPIVGLIATSAGSASIECHSFSGISLCVLPENAYWFFVLLGWGSLRGFLVDLGGGGRLGRSAAFRNMYPRRAFIRN